MTGSIGYTLPNQFIDIIGFFQNQNCWDVFKKVDSANFKMLNHIQHSYQAIHVSLILILTKVDRANQLLTLNQK